MAEGQGEYGFDDGGFLEYRAVHQRKQGQRAQLQGQILAGDAHGLHQSSTKRMAGGSAEEKERPGG
eukprot:12085896-Heterocapsa_arctica.AAC.1